MEQGLTTFIKIRRPTKDIEKRPWHTYHYALEVSRLLHDTLSRLSQWEEVLVYHRQIIRRCEEIHSNYISNTFEKMYFGFL